jgi:hypothetical protein
LGTRPSIEPFRVRNYLPRLFLHPANMPCGLSVFQWDNPRLCCLIQTDPLPQVLRLARSIATADRAKVFGTAPPSTLSRSLESVPAKPYDW